MAAASYLVGVDSLAVGASYQVVEASYLLEEGSLVAASCQG